MHPSYVDALNLQNAVVADLGQDLELKEDGIIIDLPESLSLDGYYRKLRELSEGIDGIPTGTAGQGGFEDLVGDVIRMCFYRALANVEAQQRNYGGTVVLDWVASNVAQAGFWEIIRVRYKAVQVVWECKNYADLKAEDFQQAAYYMSEAGGKFVVIVFRGKIKNHYYGHIRRIHEQIGGIVLLLTEKDISVFLRQSLNGKVKDSHIQNIYDRTIRQIS